MLRHVSKELGSFEYDPKDWVIDVIDSGRYIIRYRHAKVQDEIITLPEGCVNCSHMFEKVELENCFLDGFDRGDIVDMSHMFKGASLIHTNVSDNFDVSSVRTMKNMFCNCSILDGTYVSFRTWNTELVKDFDGMLDTVHYKRFNELETLRIGNSFKEEPRLFGKADTRSVLENVFYINDVPSVGETQKFNTLIEGLSERFEQLVKLGLDSSDSLRAFTIALFDKYSIGVAGDELYAADATYEKVDFGTDSAFVLKNVSNLVVESLDGSGDAEEDFESIVIYPKSRKYKMMFVLVKDMKSSSEVSEDLYSFVTCYYVPREIILSMDVDSKERLVDETFLPETCMFDREVVLPAAKANKFVYDVEDELYEIEDSRTSFFE